MKSDYMRLHLEWREEIRPPDDAEIDESVFEEIYKEEMERRKERGDYGDLETNIRLRGAV